MSEAMDAGKLDAVDRGGSGTGARKVLALVSLAVGLAAAVAGTVAVRAAVRRMPALTPTDSMIVAGGRPGTPGAAAPSPVRPPLRRTPPPKPARSRREVERGLGGPSSSEPPSFPRLR